MILIVYWIKCEFLVIVLMDCREVVIGLRFVCVLDFVSVGIVGNCKVVRKFVIDKFSKIVVSGIMRFCFVKVLLLIKFVKIVIYVYVFMSVLVLIRFFLFNFCGRIDNFVGIKKVDWILYRKRFVSKSLLFFVSRFIDVSVVKLILVKCV